MSNKHHRVLRVTLLAGCITCVALSCVKGFAEVIAAWDVAGIELDDGSYTDSYGLMSDTTATHIATAGLSLSGTVNPSTSSDQYGFKISLSDATNSLDGAIAGGHYIQISIAVSENHLLHLDRLEINGTSSGTGCDDIAILSSVDGFVPGAVIASVTGVQDVTGGWDTDDSGFDGPIDLSAPRFRALDSIIIRIYGWNSSSGAGVSWIRNLAGYDIVLNGTVEYVPPEGGVITVR